MRFSICWESPPVTCLTTWMTPLKNTKKNSWTPLAEPQGYKKSYLIRKQEEREAEEEIDEFELVEEEFPVNDEENNSDLS